MSTRLALWFIYGGRRVERGREVGGWGGAEWRNGGGAYQSRGFPGRLGNHLHDGDLPFPKAG